MTSFSEANSELARLRLETQEEDRVCEEGDREKR